MDKAESIKTMELDKICRVCLTIKKDMRPLFGEMIADMLMECTRIQVDDTDGWPDKICIQCVHQVSRCHAFKTRVEKSDQQLRQYIKGITVIVEESITPIGLQRTNLQSHQVQRTDIQQHQLTCVDTQNNHIQLQSNPRQEIQLTRTDLTTGHTTADVKTAQPTQMIITNGQLHNAQIINAGQIVTTAQGQQVIQTGANGNGGGTTTATSVQNTAGQNVQLCQLVQAGNGTVQMIPQNGQAAQLVQIQRTSDDRCEIIVHPDLQGDTQFYTDDDLKHFVTVTQTMNQEEIQDDNVQLIEEIEEIEDDEEEDEEQDKEPISIFTLDLTDDDDCEDKEYLAEFISMQTSCPYPGKFVCNLCRKEFKHSRWLNTHMKSHSNWIKANCKKQPQCQICYRSFKGPGMLKMHMKTHEKQPEKIPTCKVCNKEFKSKTILYRHRQTHLQKNMQCGVCQLSFRTLGQLQSHQTKSNHEKCFKCAHCSRIFTNGNDLKLHIQQHLSANKQQT